MTAPVAGAAAAALVDVCRHRAASRHYLAAWVDFGGDWRRVAATMHAAPALGIAAFDGVPFAAVSGASSFELETSQTIVQDNATGNVSFVGLVTVDAFGYVF